MVYSILLYFTLFIYIRIKNNTYIYYNSIISNELHIMHFVVQC